MAKITLSDVTNFVSNSSAVAATTSNNNAIETALENTLSRDGTTPNTMGANLDMNSHRIVNLPRAINNTEPVRLREFNSAVFGTFDFWYINITDFDGSPDSTAAENAEAINSAWSDGGGLPIYFPGPITDVYEIDATALDSPEAIKGFGQASYILSEDGAFINPYPTLDDDGLSDDSYTVTGSDDVVFQFAETPQFIYAMPNSTAARGINLVYGSAAPDLDPRYSTWTYIAGDEKTAASLLYSNRLTIVGEGSMPLVQRVQHATILGSHILTLARCEFHRADISGSGAMGQALAIRTRNDDAFDSIGYAHEYQNKTWWVNNAAGATKQWLRDAGVSANSGLRHNYEAAASAWVTSHSYTKGDWVAQNSRNYWCLVSHTSGVFATDLAAATPKWFDTGPVVVTVYSPSDENDVANIVTLGDVGAGRKLNTFDDARFFSSRGRDNMNHAFKVTNSNATGYRCLATPKEIDNVDGMGNYAFQRGFGNVANFAFIGRSTGEHTQRGESSFSGGAYNFQWATTVWGASAIGYKVGQYAACGPAVGVSDSSWTDWATSTSYTGGVAGAGTYVIVSSIVYRCVTSHTSGVWATDLAAAKWIAVDDYEPSAIYLESDYDHATRGKVQTSVISGHFAAWNTGRILRSFVSGLNVMDQAYGAVDDIVIGSYGLRYSRSTTGKRIILGGNSYPYLKFGNLFSVYSDTLSRGSISSNLAAGGVILNANPSGNMTTATSADRITKPLHIWNLAGAAEVASVSNTGQYEIGGSLIIGARKTGWSVPTSTLARAALADYTAQTISAVPTQTEVQNIDNRIEILNNTLAALINDIHSGGASSPTHALLTT